MSSRTFVGFIAALVVVIVLAAGLFFLLRGGVDSRFEATFDTAGSWGTGSDINAEGRVQNGVFDFLIKASSGLFWSTAGANIGDGVYQVEATQVAGPLDNGYGLIFRFDGDRDDFYIFEVSGDGFVWIGHCEQGCSEGNVPLVGDGWVESTAVNQGLNATNLLRVRAEGGNMIFFVNEQEVGRTSHNALDKGDIGLVVEAFGQGGVRVHFDNFRVTPVESVAAE